MKLRLAMQTSNFTLGCKVPGTTSHWLRKEPLRSTRLPQGIST
jgi:hypothetical protein